jgi:hypothetical protein
MLDSGLTELLDEGEVVHVEVAESSSISLSVDSVKVGGIRLHSAKLVINEEEVLVGSSDIITDQNPVIMIYCRYLTPELVLWDVSNVEERALPHQYFLRVRRESEVRAYIQQLFIGLAAVDSIYLIGLSHIDSTLIQIDSVVIVRLELNVPSL